MAAFDFVRFAETEPKERINKALDELCLELKDIQACVNEIKPDWGDPIVTWDFRERVSCLASVSAQLDDYLSLASITNHYNRNASVDMLLESLTSLSDQYDIASWPVYYDFDDCGVDDYMISYRGIYTCIALQKGESTVLTLRNALNNKRRDTIYGYKGGEYRTYGITPVWVAEYGVSDGRPAQGFKLDLENKRVILITGEPYEEDC